MKAQEGNEITIIGRKIDEETQQLMYKVKNREAEAWKPISQLIHLSLQIVNYEQTLAKSKIEPERIISQSEKKEKSLEQNQEKNKNKSFDKQKKRKRGRPPKQKIVNTNKVQQFSIPTAPIYRQDEAQTEMQFWWEDSDFSEQNFKIVEVYQQPNQQKLIFEVQQNKEKKLASYWQILDENPLVLIRFFEYQIK